MEDKCKTEEKYRALINPIFHKTYGIRFYIISCEVSFDIGLIELQFRWRRLLWQIDCNAETRKWLLTLIVAEYRLTSGI